MISLQNVAAAAASISGRLPQIGERWIRKDGRVCEIVGVTENQFGPLDIKEDDGKITHRTRDGRFAMMGARGACDEDLVQLMEAIR